MQINLFGSLVTRFHLGMLSIRVYTHGPVVPTFICALVSYWKFSKVYLSDLL